MAVYSKPITPAAAVGREPRRRKPKDNLTLDAMDALAAGMTYGEWKAQHPETAAANESRLSRPAKAYQEQPKVYEFTCRGCGKKFTTQSKQRRYCDDRCKQKKNKADWLGAHPKNTEEGEE